MRLFNTASGLLEEVSKSEHLGVYVCGITPAGADPRAHVAEVRAALDDDLDVPRAVRAVADLAESILQGGSDSTAVDGLLACCNILGLLPLVSRFS
jgi:cysteinyl-tRNA synthetase